jgi:hypothetical protein
MLSVLASGARLGGGGAVEVPLLRIAGAFVACVLVAGLAILLLRQRLGRGTAFTLRGGARTAPAIDLVEMRRLGVHGDVAVVRHRDREYLLVVQATGITRLDTRNVETVP